MPLTVYAVQVFEAGRQGPASGRPIIFEHEVDARNMAESLGRMRSSVLLWRQEVDPASGECGEPHVLAWMGQVMQA
jgi:hypothetical protein